MTKIDKIYEGQLPALNRAKSQLRSLLNEIITKIEDKKLVRAEVINIRIKKPASIQLKAKLNGWKENEALSRCDDLIGGRVICNNIEDIFRFAELLQEKLPAHPSMFNLQDYMNNPKEEGYRALHVNFRLYVARPSLQPSLIPCEVQIRSHLQDAWAKLSHGDIYKQLNIPLDLRARVKDLAEVLAAADRIAGDIRSRAMEIVPSERRPDINEVSLESLAFSFKKVFGRSPSDYAARSALNLCAELQITSLKGFPNPDPLARRRLRKKIARAYQLIMRVDMANEDIFLAMLHAFAKNNKGTLRWVQKHANYERKRIKMAEEVGPFPNSVEELIKAIDDPYGDVDIEGWAKAFGASHSCALCGTTIIQPSSFADSMTQYYKILPDKKDDICEQIKIALWRSSEETGGWDDNSLCAYHEDKLSKND